MDEYQTKDLYPHAKRLSSTQLLDYIKSPADFYVRWVLGSGNESSMAMGAGRVFSALYADRSLDFKKYLDECHAPRRYKDVFEKAIAKFPVLKGGHPEYPLVAKHKGWEFRATLDDFVESQYLIVENKTGKTEWTQERANFSEQITFQAWCHWKKYEIIPRKIIVNWVDLRPSATKLIHTFNTSRSINGLKQFEKLVDTVIEGIEAENFNKPIY